MRAFDCERRRTSAGEQVGERKLPHLLGGHLDKFFIAVTKRGAPKPGHAFDVRLALRVIDIDALRPFDDERSRFTEAGEVGVGMYQRFNVAGGQIAERRHAERRHGIFVLSMRAFDRERRRALAAFLGRLDVIGERRAQAPR